MTLADDEERDRLAAHERELEAAKPPLEKLREWEQQKTSRASNVALYFVVSSVALVIVWRAIQC